MIPEDLLFWIAPLSATPDDQQNLLCIRHADAMSVPRGWTLDDRREEVPRLFRPRSVATPDRPGRAPRRKRPQSDVEQLQIDGTGEIDRPAGVTAATIGPSGMPVESTPDLDGAPWAPSFDPNDDLDGLLEVTSPLLARAFRGTDRPRG